MTDVAPPPITVVWCPKCERTDRFGPLKGGHFSKGKRCGGEPIRVRYEPVRQQPLRERGEAP